VGGVGEREEVWVIQSLRQINEMSRDLERPETMALTSLALILLRGSYSKHLPSKFRQSALAAVKRSLSGVFWNCPTGT
jgi:hypothetical protein